MMGPGQTHQCVGCSFEVDNAESVLVHLANNDVTYVAVARAPIEEIEVLRKRMSWALSVRVRLPQRFQLRLQRVLHAASRSLRTAPSTISAGSNRRLEDLSGDSVFFKDEAGQIFLHLFGLWPRRRAVSRRLRISRRGAEGAKRDRAVHRSLSQLGTTARHVRQGWHGRAHRPLSRRRLRLRRSRLSDSDVLPDREPCSIASDRRIAPPVSASPAPGGRRRGLAAVSAFVSRRDRRRGTGGAAISITTLHAPTPAGAACWPRCWRSRSADGLPRAEAARRRSRN